jgi:hypothetical protein
MLATYKFNPFNGDLYPVPTYSDVGAAPISVPIRRLPPAGVAQIWDLVSGDAGSLILTNTDWTVRIPTSINQPFPVGTQILILPIDNSEVKLISGGPTLIYVPGSNKQVLIKISDTEWVVA